MPRAKKVVVKEVPVEPVEIVVQTIPETYKYNVTLEFNDQAHEFRTNDIAQSIYDLKPINLKTRVLFKATSEEGTCERMLGILGAGSPILGLATASNFRKRGSA